MCSRAWCRARAQSSRLLPVLLFWQASVQAGVAVWKLARAPIGKQLVAGPVAVAAGAFERVQVAPVLALVLLELEPAAD
ncbi:MAG TPA: hypothetical protein VKV04_04395 [Verrucomicrobiae bacterium]|nr:hypothetical protein [Verrucomicrobiae bacterium]